MTAVWNTPTYQSWLGMRRRCRRAGGAGRDGTVSDTREALLQLAERDLLADSVSALIKVLREENGQ